MTSKAIKEFIRSLDANDCPAQPILDAIVLRESKVDLVFRTEPPRIILMVERGADNASVTAYCDEARLIVAVSDKIRNGSDAMSFLVDMVVELTMNGWSATSVICTDGAISLLAEPHDRAAP